MTDNTSEIQPQNTTGVDSSEVLKNREKGTPFINDLASVSVVVEGGDNTDKFSKYESMKRSLVEEVSRNKVVWGGENPADVYGARDEKGTGSETTPHIRIIAKQGGVVEIETEGLLDQDEIDLFEISDTVRSKLNLPTEKISRVQEIHQISVNGKLLSVDEWRDWALKDSDRVVKDFFKAQLKLTPPLLRYSLYPLIQTEIFLRKKFQIMPKIRDYIKKVEFFVLERELQTEERLRDIANCRDESSFNNVMGPVFKWLNTATDSRNSGLIPGTPNPKPFDINNEDDVKRYFGDWLPAQMGIYLGRMHKNGYLAIYPHAQNWSAVGTLYDLGSCFQSMDDRDKNKSEKPQKVDLYKTASALCELLLPPEGNYLKKHYPGVFSKALVSLITNYHTETGGSVDAEKLEVLFYTLNANTYLINGDGSEKRRERIISKEEFIESVAIPLGVELGTKDLFY